LNYPNFSSTVVASIMKSLLLGRSDRLPIQSWTARPPQSGWRLRRPDHSNSGEGI